jgi:hypothetical protein
MKLFIVFSMVIAATVAAPGSYYQQPPPQRATQPPPPPPPPRYEAPKYEAPKYDSYGTKMAAPQEHIPIITHTFDTDHKGTYRLELETGNGIKGNAQGVLKDIGAAEGPIVAKSGSYSYPGDDGKTYTVNWTADETGFHATGDHLPTPPPIPEEIRKSLEVPRIPEFQPDFKPEMRSNYGYSAPETRQPSYGYAPPPPPASPPVMPPRSPY